MNLAEMRQELGEKLDQMRKINDVAHEEKRDFTADEQEKYEKIERDFDSLEKEIKRVEKHEERVKALALQQSMQKEPTQEPGAADYRSVLWKSMRFGASALADHEVRALQVGTNSEGGYTVDNEFEAQLIKALDDMNIMRRLGRVTTSSHGTLSIPTVSGNSTAAWTAEEAAFNESDMAFGTVTFNAYKSTVLTKVSEELLHDSAIDVGAEIAMDFGRALGILEEAAFVNGDGSSKPTGIVGSSGLGITAAGAAAITADEVIDLYHSLGRAYRMNATFLMADATAKIIRKLKDGNSQYLWQPGLQAGDPSSILGRPVEISDNVPAATTGLKSVIFADFGYYRIIDRGPRVLQRLNELYSVNGQVGFRVSQRTDGKLTLPAAAKHLIQA